MAELLKGAPVAAAITQDIADRAEKLKNEGIVPAIAIIRIGEKPDDLSYERGMIKRFEKAGIKIYRNLLPETCSRDELTALIARHNADDNIHGVLLFRPLADKASEMAAAALLNPEKDVDAMTEASLAGVFTGSGSGFAPCTAQACMEVLKYYDIPLRGANAVVIGRSPVIGKPVSMLLQKADATVTMCHTKTKDLPSICRNADIIVAAAGKAGMVDKSFVREGQIIIDVGINFDEDGRLCGDVKTEEVEPVVRGITPVPGGVGAVTTSVLAMHVVEAAEKCLGRR